MDFILEVKVITVEEHNRNMIKDSDIVNDKTLKAFVSYKFSLGKFTMQCNGLRLFKINGQFKLKFPSSDVDMGIGQGIAAPIIRVNEAFYKLLETGVMKQYETSMKKFNPVVH